MNDSDSKIPVAIIAGYLGAGKTTFLNQLLRENQGQRVAVLVNDFGSLNIDAELIESQDGETIRLSNGCACCSIGGDVLAAMRRVVKSDDPPDRILLEASGIANPEKLAHYGQVLRETRLEGVVVLVDSEQVWRLIKDKYVSSTVKQQLSSADLLVLNKIDLVSEEELAHLQDWIRQNYRGARISSASFGDIAKDIVLDVSLRKSAADSLLTYSGDKHSDNNHAHVSWVVNPGDDLSVDKLKAILQRLPASVVRVKGFVRCSEESSSFQLVQVVGKRISIESVKDSGQIEGLVLIAAGNVEEDKVEVARQFNAG